MALANHSAATLGRGATNVIEGADAAGAARRLASLDVGTAVRYSDLMRSRMTATAASRNFSSVLDRVQHHGERIVVERDGEAVCEIVPALPLRRTMTEIAQLLRDLEPPDEAFARDVREVARKQARASRKSPWGR